MDIHLKLRQARIHLRGHNAHLEDVVRQQVPEASDWQMATIFALAKLSESRDEDTGRHLERVRVFCRMLAVRLGEGAKHRTAAGASYIENIFHASPLHDVGKAAIPDSVLLKHGRLTSGEFEIVKRHTMIGAYALGLVGEQFPGNGFISLATEIARWHHEKWDGSGYPDGLKGDEIPLSARIVAMADVYDTLRSRRCYKPALSHQEACEGILMGSRGHFDPDVIEAFSALHGEFADVWLSMQD